jgi:hypothetical protein
LLLLRAKGEEGRGRTVVVHGAGPSRVHNDEELGKHAAKDKKKTCIIPRHVLLAIRNDEELDKLLAGVTIAHSGVLSAHHPRRTPLTRPPRQGDRSRGAQEHRRRRRPREPKHAARHG